MSDFVIIDDPDSAPLGVLVLDDPPGIATLDREIGEDFLLVLDEVVEAVPDFLVMDPPPIPPSVQDEDTGEDVLVLTSGGMPGPPGPQGPSGALPYEHEQTDPASSWTVEHNLGYRPNVWLFVDSAPDELVHTDVTYPDDNTVYIEWPSPESGRAYVR